MGLDPDSIGRKCIEDLTGAFMARAGIEDPRRYADVLKVDPGEAERLVEQLVVPETWFFRDMEAFNFLRKHLTEGGRARRDGRPIRLLSVPCSTGEEPYSIAMVLVDAGFTDGDFLIDGVDISGRSLETARRALYGKSSFRVKNTAGERHHFTPVDEGYRLDPRLAGLVHFSRDNFVRPDALAGREPYDIVFCKNLLIYLTEDARKRVLANIARLLVPGGLLFTGHSEMMLFLQCGYRPVRHERAFACTRSEDVPERAGVPVKRRRPAAKMPAVAPRPVRAGAKLPAPSAASEKEGRREEEGIAPSVIDDIRRLADTGRLDEAARRCELFLTEHSPVKEIFYLMGLIHLARNAFDRAELFFRKALYMDPHYYDALVHMELLYEKKGDRAQASIMSQRIKRFQEGAGKGQETP
jgi:chemotaxis protein methyltransferase WspC